MSSRVDLTTLWRNQKFLANNFYDPYVELTPLCHVDWEGSFSQMTLLLHKPYLVNVTAMGEGGEKYPKI